MQSKGITIRYKHTLLGTLGQDRAGQGRAGQGYMEQAGWVMGGKAGHRKGQGQGQGQGKAGPIQAGQGRAGQGNVWVLVKQMSNARQEQERKSKRHSPQQASQ